MWGGTPPTLTVSCLPGYSLVMTLTPTQRTEVEFVIGQITCDASAEAIRALLTAYDAERARADAAEAALAQDVVALRTRMEMVEQAAGEVVFAEMDDATRH